MMRKYFLRLHSGSGAVGMLGYGLTRLRARRKSQ